MDKHLPLAPEALYRNCDPELLPFKTTESLEPFTGFFGQDRAIEAMAFGIGMQRPGYNLFRNGQSAYGTFLLCHGQPEKLGQKAEQAQRLVLHQQPE